MVQGAFEGVAWDLFEERDLRDRAARLRRMSRSEALDLARRLRAFAEAVRPGLALDPTWRAEDLEAHRRLSELLSRTGGR